MIPIILAVVLAFILGGVYHVKVASELANLKDHVTAAVSALEASAQIEETAAKAKIVTIAAYLKEKL